MFQETASANAQTPKHGPWWSFYDGHQNVSNFDQARAQQNAADKFNGGCSIGQAAPGPLHKLYPVDYVSIHKLENGFVIEPFLADEYLTCGDFVSYGLDAAVSLAKQMLRDGVEAKD